MARRGEHVARGGERLARKGGVHDRQNTPGSASMKVRKRAPDQLANSKRASSNWITASRSSRPPAFNSVSGSPLGELMAHVGEHLAQVGEHLAQGVSTWLEGTIT